MASPASVGLILLLSHLVQLLSAQEHGGQSCPSSFQCGTLGVFGYPFTTIFNPSCGLCILNCTEPAPTIRLDRRGPWYDITHSFSYNRTFLVNDSLLLHVVNDDGCEIFDKGFRLPTSTSVSFTILNIKTMWKCPTKFELSPRNKSDTNTTLREILGCKDYDIYHDYDDPYHTYEDKLPGCEVVQYPDILIVEPSDNCSKCITEAGRCQDLKNGEFKCVHKTKERRKLILLLGLGCLGGSFILTVIGIIFCHLRRVNLGLPTFSSRNISADPTTTDLGRSKMYFSLPVFSYSELEEATKNFDPTMELGNGGFGTVYYGKLKDGREVAVKRLYERNYRQLEQFMNEIEILTSLRHQNLVSLYGCTSRRSRELLLVYEYLPNGTVADHLYGDQGRCGTLTWPIRMSIAIETARALSYLHASDIIHRDVKTCNILLDNNFSVKVADFGLSRLFPTDITHISTAPQGTPGYLDPEYHQCYQLTDKSDVYSFGVVLIELISSLPAVDICRKDEVNLSCYAMKRIQCCAFGDLIDPRLGFESNHNVRRTTTSVAELAFQCLQDKKDLRPSMDEVLEALKSIESADFEDSKVQTDADYDWLLRNAENPPSPNTVMHKWGSTKSITPTSSR